MCSDQLSNVNDYKQWYNNKSGEQMTYFMNIVLFNVNKIILEMIHPAANHCCIYVDPTFFNFVSGMQLWYQQIITYHAN